MFKILIRLGRAENEKYIWSLEELASTILFICSLLNRGEIFSNISALIPAMSKLLLSSNSVIRESMYPFFFYIVPNRTYFRDFFYDF